MKRNYFTSQVSKSYCFNEMALEEALRSEQVKILYSSPVAIFFNLIVASIVAVVLWHICPAWILFLWLALFGIVVGARFIDQKRYLGEPIVHKAAKYWRRRYVFGCAATGVLWGGFAVSVGLITSDPIYRVFICFVIGGMIAGAILQHGAYLPAFYAYAGFAVLPPILAEFGFRDRASLGMGFALAAYALVTGLIGRRNNRWITDTLRLRIEQTAMAADLQAKIEENEQINAQREKAAKEIEHIYRFSPVGLFQLDKDSRFVRINQRMAEISGLPVEAHIGRTLREVVPDLAARLMEICRPVYEQGEAISDAEIHGIAAHLPGVWRDWIVSFFPTFSAAGEVVGLNGAFVEITERKRAEQAARESEAQLNAYFDAAPMGMGMVDRQLRYLKINQRLAEMIRLPVGGILGKRIHEVVPQVAEILEPLYREVFATGRPIVNFELSHETDARASELHDFQISYFPLMGEEAKPKAVGLVVTEITEQKRAAEAMRQSRSDLIAARDAAESASEIKSRFLANMSHEIRTPMNGVLGMTEILLDTPLTPRQREFAETIQSSANALLVIINDILDFSKLEAGMLHFERVLFNLHATIESVIDSFVQSARKKGLELAFLVEKPVPVSVAGDQFRLRQVLTNLLSNAIKFTDSGEVVLRCSMLSSNEGEINLRFEVADTGIGISPEDLERLFHPFVQADASTTKHFGGTGLGLAISRQLVTGMGGAMGVESTPTVGSKFWFTSIFGMGDTAAPERLPMGGLHNVRILIVGDNATNRKILHYQVSAWGMRDSEASSGPAALALLLKGAALGDPYPVVILDAQMPELTGYQVVKRIRDDPSIAPAKVILLTSVEPAGVPADLVKQVDAVMSKPVKQSQLFETVSHVIGIGTKAPAARVTKKEPVASTLHERKLRVLLVEDNPVNQRVVLYRLRMLEQHVDLAQDGVEALKLFDANEYDLVLMDIQLPKLDGYSATAEIRRREKARNQKHTWIIALTANALPEDREKCLAAGMDDYLAKPIPAQALVYALEKCVDSLGTQQPATNLQLLVDSGIGDMVPQIISIFLESAPGDIEKMRIALEAKDTDGLAGAAHSLKGSCSNLGASGLRDLCQQIENHGRSGSLDEVFKLLESVDLEFGRVKSELLTATEEWPLGLVHQD